MLFLLVLTAILVLATLVASFLLGCGFLPRRFRSRAFWKRLLLVNLCFLPLQVLVFVPALLGFMGTRLVGTRHDERSYRGPVLDAAGALRIQSRNELIGDDAGRVPPVRIPTQDGRTLRGFFLPCPSGAPRLRVVLFHGLFRSAMELEPVAAMFCRAGAEVLLAEMSNHGGSDRHRFTFGLEERDDVLAAVRWLRSHEGASNVPLALFGVSLGGVAVARAAPDVENLAGLVIDAPMTDLPGTARRDLRRFLGMPDWYLSILLASLELWSGIDMADVRPIEDLRRLPPTIPVLLFGAGQDRRVPPEIVRACYDALAAKEGTKTLCVVDGARHGQIWITAHEEYERQIREFVGRVVR